MKRILTALVSLIYISANAQTADEVITKYADKMGGASNFAKIKTAKLSGTLQMQGQEVPIEIKIVNGKAARIDLEVAGNQIISAYANGKGWKVNPFAGADTPTEITGTELADLKTQSMVGSAFVNYKAGGYTAEYKGQEDHNGVKAHKIVLINPVDKKPTSYFINASDYSLIASVTEREMMGQTAEIETVYSNPKTVKGLTFYSTRVQKAGGTDISSITLDTIEFDQPIDEKIFEMPK
jgi:hypothetical protein